MLCVVLFFLFLSSCGFFVPDLPQEPVRYYDCELLNHRLSVAEPINDEIYFDFSASRREDFQYFECKIALHNDRQEIELDKKSGGSTEDNPDECVLSIPDSNLYIVFNYDKNKNESFVNVLYPDMEGEHIASDLELTCTYKEE